MATRVSSPSGCDRINSCRLSISAWGISPFTCWILLLSKARVGSFSEDIMAVHNRYKVYKVVEAVGCFGDEEGGWPEVC